MATETIDPAEFGLNPADLATGTREQVMLEIAAAPGEVRNFPFAYADETRMDEAALDSRMASLLAAGEAVPAKREQLSAYRDYRRARGEKSFAYLDLARRREQTRTFREQLPMLRAMFAGPEKFAEAFPAEQREAVEGMFSTSLNADAEKRQTANKILFEAMTGQSPDPELWPIQRTIYAQENLGWRGATGVMGGDGAAAVAPTVIGDDAFYHLAGRVLEEEYADGEIGEKVMRMAEKSALDGLPISQARDRLKEIAGPRWREFEPALRQGFASIYGEASDDEIRLVRPLFEEMAKMEKAATEDVFQGDMAEVWASYGRADQNKREKILGLLGLTVQAEGHDVEGFLSRASGAVRRGILNLAMGAGGAGVRSEADRIEELLKLGVVPVDADFEMERAGDLIGRMHDVYTPAEKGRSKVKTRPLTDEEKQRFQTQVDAIRGAADFLADLQSQVPRIKRFTDDKREGFWDRLGDYSIIAVESLPTMAYSALPYGVGLVPVTQMYAEQAISDYRRDNPGMATEDLEALGYAAGVMQAGIDRLQWFTMGARMPALKAKVLQWGAPGAVANYAGRAAFVTGTESAQEVVQDLTAPAMQDLAASLSEDIKGPDWDKVLKQEREALGDIVGVSLIFGIIGVTGSTIADHMEAPKIREALSDRSGLRLAGYETADVDNIVATAQENPLAAAELLKAATAETSVETRQKNSAAAREEIEAEAETLNAKEAGLPTLERLEDGKIQVNYPDRAAEVVEGTEAAVEAVRGWEEDAGVSNTQAVRSYVDFLTGYHSSSPETAFRGETQQNLGTLQDVARRNADQARQARARLAIAARQAGVEMGLNEVDLAAIPIIGTSDNRTARGITTIAARFSKEATPLTVIEEAAEGVAKWLMDSGKVGSPKMLGWIREAEVKTGRSLLGEDFASKDGQLQRQEIVEAWSYLAQANATGQVQDSSLPAAVKSFFRAFKEAILAALRIAADFARVRGELDPEFTYWLDVSAGINEEFEHENLVRQMEAEMEAEAFDGLPEIGEVLKGRLPHPETLRREGHPLVGEVRRIYDGIVQSGGSRSAGRRRANEYFLPAGEMTDLDDVRERANRSGFGFATPGEMLDALDLSVNYGKRQYGFGEAAEADLSFSISTDLRTLFPKPPEAYTFTPSDEQRTEILEIAEREGVVLVSSPDLSAGARQLGEALGVELFFFRGHPEVIGFTPKDRPELIFINSAPRVVGIPVSWTAAHELVHVAQKDAGTNASALAGKIEDLLSPQERAAVHAELESYGYSPETFATEAPAFFTGDAISGESVFGLDGMGNADAIRAEITGFVDRLQSLHPEPVTPRLTESPDESLSISLRGKDPLGDAIAARIKDPEAKAEIYKRMLKLVAGVRKRFDQKRIKGEFAKGGLDRARFEEARDLATLEAVAKALPVEVRGRFVGAFTQLDKLRTAAGREKYTVELLNGVEKAVETHLQGLFRQKIRAVLKKGEIKVSEAKTRGGKISPHGHDVFEMARNAMLIADDPAGKDGRLTATEKAEIEIERLTEQIEGAGDISPERLDELDAMRAAVELFYDYENADSARLERAAEFLTETYQQGREAWLGTLALRKEIRSGRVEAFRKGVGAPDFIRRGDRRNDEAKIDASKWKGLDEGIMALGLSGSQTIRRLGELTDDPAARALAEEMEAAAHASEANEADRNAADDAALAKAMREIFGTQTQYSLAKKLREYSDESKDAPVTTLEGRKDEVVSVPINYVEALVEGEASGFDRPNGSREELSDADRAALREEWEKFQDLTEEERSRKRVIPFIRRVAAGERLGIGRWSKFGGLQLWLTMRQPDQAAKLEGMGYDSRTLRELEAWLPADLKELGLWMVNRIGADAFAVDSMHRTEKGVGLPLVDQYFPVRNRVGRASTAGMSLDGQPQQQSGRNVGFIKQRVTNQAEPAHVNALAVFLQHRAQSNFWLSHVTFMREWGGVIRDERFADAVRTKMGEKYYSSLTKVFRRIESGGRLRADALNDLEVIAKGLTSRFAMAVLGGRVSTLMVNTTAVLNAAWEVPARDLLKGALMVAKRPEAFRDAWNSPAIQRRLRDGATFETVLARGRGPTTRPVVALLDHWARQGLRPINFVDTSANMAGAVAVWEYTRAAGLRAGLSEVEAREAADRKTELVLLRAAQPQSRLARSELEFMAMESPLSALFTLFVSEPRKNAAITYMALRKLVTGKGTASKGMAVQQAIVGVFLAAAAENLVRSFYQAWAKAKDDEEDELLERWWGKLSDPKAWGYKLTTQYLQNVPIFGEVWTRLMAQAFDQKAFPASQNPLDQAIRASEAILRETSDNKPATTEERIELAIKSLQGFGPVVPGGPLAAQGGNIADFIEGITESEEEKLARYKGRYRKFSRELDETFGKTQGEDGKIRKDVKAKKDRAKADWVKGEISALPDAERKAVLEQLDLTQDVQELVN